MISRNCKQKQRKRRRPNTRRKKTITLSIKLLHLRDKKNFRSIWQCNFLDLEIGWRTFTVLIDVFAMKRTSFVHKESKVSLYMYNRCISKSQSLAKERHHHQFIRQHDPLIMMPAEALQYTTNRHIYMYNECICTPSDKLLSRIIDDEMYRSLFRINPRTDSRPMPILMAWRKFRGSVLLTHWQTCFLTAFFVKQLNIHNVFFRCKNRVTDD